MKRINLDIDELEYQKFLKITQESNFTMSGCLRQAIRLYCTMMEYQNAGAKIMVDEKQIILL